jgi:flagellin-specific chaperone FliS
LKASEKSEAFLLDLNYFNYIKMTKTIIIFLFLLSSLIPNVNAQTEDKNPEELFIMLFDAIIRQDTLAIESLNEYDKLNRLENTYETESHTKEFFSKFSSELSGEKLQKCKYEINDLISAINNNFINSEMIINSLKETQEGDANIISIKYSVNFRVPQKLSDISFVKMKKMKSDDLKMFLIKVTEQIKNANKIVTAQESFPLFKKTKGEKIYYETGFLKKEKLKSDLLGFYYYNLLKASEYK